MKFELASDLGEWAREYSVARVTFHADGTLRTADFVPTPAVGAEPDAETDKTPRRPAVNRALEILQGRRVGTDG